MSAEPDLATRIHLRMAALAEYGAAGEWRKALAVLDLLLVDLHEARRMIAELTDDK